MILVHLGGTAAACVGGVPLHVLGGALVVHGHLGRDGGDDVRVDGEDRGALGAAFVVEEVVLLGVHSHRVLQHRGLIGRLLLLLCLGVAFLFSCQLEN